VLNARSLAALVFMGAGVAIGASLDAALDQYCSACHNNQVRTAGLSLESVAPSQTDILEKVLRKLRSGEMPPAKMPAPSPDERRALVASLESQLDRAAAAHPNPGKPGVHRLNRAEYRNAIRDLTGLDLGHSAALPPDDSSFGFDNIAAALTVSPLHMEKYLSAARRIARQAVGTGKPSVSSEKFTAQPSRRAAYEDGAPASERGGLLFLRYFPFDAEYGFVVRVGGTPAPGLPPAKLDVRLDGRRLKLFDAEIDTAEANQGTRNFEVRTRLTTGEHEVSAGFLTEAVRVEAPPRAQPNTPAPTANTLTVDNVTVSGPYQAQASRDSESRRRIFVCQTQTTACARQILGRFARLAYRRPVTEADLAPLMKLFALGRADGHSFDAGIELALSAVLVSPNFLFRKETPDDLSLASRLSFFLWSSIPDSRLLTLASTGRLHPPAVLAAEVRRMLADPKAHALAENFAGQWLHLRNVQAWKPDPEKYPQFDEPLRLAFERESSLFFSNIVAEDLSVLDFVDSGYTFLNDRLARHYGIPGIKGSYFRKVPLTGANRGGVLSQGAVLMVTSYPTRTSPVLRGKWVLENILGTPPPPPPPNVPPLDDSASNSAKSLREQLEKHRANAACASCHSRLDPLGFSLEQFDAVGGFRVAEAGATIEASGALPDGTPVNGLDGLKKIVMNRKDEFVECLAGKLLTYALGRGLEPYDQPTVRNIRRRAAANGYRFSSLVTAIVESVPFQMQTQRKALAP
jgi:cytochrome c551/c552